MTGRLLRALAVSLLLTATTFATPILAQETPLERELTDALLHGRLDAARQALDATALDRGQPLGPENPAWKLSWTPGEARQIARLLQRTGDHEAVRKLLRPLAETKKPDAAAGLILAETERQIGNAQARLALLTTLAQALPKDPQLRVRLGEQMIELGQAVAARKLLDPLADDYQDHKFESTEDLVAVAESLQLGGYPRDALSVLQTAEQGAAEPAEVVAVELALGRLFLSKYNYRDSDQAFKKVLAIDPGQPQALLGMAEIDLSSDSDVGSARRRVDKLLEQNAKLLDGLALRAEIALQDEDWPTARQMVQKGLAQRADALQVRYVQGAMCQLTDDVACWKEAEAAVRKQNRDDGHLYLRAAEYLVLGHRYRDAQKLLETALNRDGDLWQAHAAMGVALAREADDVGAKKHLELAYGGDPFDVRTANQLHVLYDDYLKNMQLVTGPSIDLRLHKRERKGLEPSLLPFLQDAVDKLSQLYGFKPERPLQVEVFPDVQAFAVRTVGLPQLGAHAVCFGHLVTSRSPAAEPFNWKMVLYHELSHVFHLQASGGRVPRWLTEGLAMMEAAWLDPRYQQRDDRRAWDRLQDGKLAKLATFNLAFSQARSMQDILDAYDQAMREVDFLAERYGKDKVRQLALQHQAGANTLNLLKKIYGKDAAQLDSEFAAWLGERLGHFARDFRPRVEAVALRLGLPRAKDDEVRVEVPKQRDPVRQALAEATLALRHGQDPRASLQKAEAAATAAGLAADSWQDLCTAQFWLMELEVHAGDRAAASKAAQALVNQPAGRCDGVRQRLVLAATNAQDPKVTIQHLRAAQAIDPRDGGVRERLRLAHEKALPAVLGKGNAEATSWFTALAGGKLGALLTDAEELAAAEMHQPQPVGDLADLAWQLENEATDTAVQAQAKTAFLHAADWYEERAPATARSPLLLARAQVLRGQPKAAMALFRLAAERSATASEQIAVWCELEKVAAQAGAKADQAEAGRRCATPAAGAAPP